MNKFRLTLVDDEFGRGFLLETGIITIAFDNVMEALNRSGKLGLFRNRYYQCSINDEDKTDFMKALIAIASEGTDNE